MSLLASANLLAKSFDRILLLATRRAKKRVALGANLVFNDARRHTDTLERANGEAKVLNETTRIGVIDERLGANLHHVVDRLKTVVQANQFSVWLALDSRLGQRRDPESIEFGAL